MTKFSVAARLQIAFIVVLLFIPVALMPLQNETRLEQFHNRRLTTWPAPSILSADPPQYFRVASRWMADRLGLFVAATLMQKRILFYVLDTAPQPRITLGKNGHLFLNGPSDASLNLLFEATCVAGHNQETSALLKNAVPKFIAFAKRYNAVADVIITPMGPTLYAEQLPNSVPRRLREHCEAVATGNSPLFSTAAIQDLRITYPFHEMKAAARGDLGFFPAGNYHPVGMSLKVLRDAYFRKIEVAASSDEKIESGTASSEILFPYGIDVPYPVYLISNPSIGEDQPANARVNSLIAEFFSSPPITHVYVNESSEVHRRALLISDLIGFCGARVRSRFQATYVDLWEWAEGL